MLVRPRQIQRAPAHAIDLSSGSVAGITVPAQRVGISTARSLTFVCWMWPTVQFPNGTFLWMLSNSGSNSPDLNVSFASFGLFGGSENATINVNPAINPSGWNLIALSWTPAGVLNMWAISRSAKNFGTGTGATTSLTVGATTNLVVGNRGTVDAGYPCRMGGFFVYGRALSQQEVFAHARQRGPVSSDQLLVSLSQRDLGTAGYDEVLDQAWPLSGAISTVAGPGIGQPDVNPATQFFSGSSGSSAPKDPLFFGVNA